MSVLRNIHRRLLVVYLCSLAVRSGDSCLLEKAGMCYEVPSEAKTWSAAEDACGRTGGHLMSLSSKDDQTTLETLTTTARLTNLWVGGRETTDTTLLWRWIPECTTCGLVNNGTSLAPQGCFDEWTSRREFLLENKVTVPLLTPEKCQRECANRNFMYAAVQGGDACFCGETFGRYGAQSYCNKPCAGDSTQTCGGRGLNYVYRVGGDYGSWGSGQPSGENDLQTCGALDHRDGYKMDDTECTNNFRFLCDVPECPATIPAASQYRFIDGHCMYVSHSEVVRSWFQARQFCHLLGGDLAIIRSAAAHFAVRQWLETKPAYKTRTWIGLAKTVWYWTTGVDIKYSKFDGSEPSSADRKCVYIDVADNSVWKTAECGTAKRFICQTEIPTTTTPVPTTTTESPTTTTVTTAATTTTTITTAPVTDRTTTTTKLPNSTPLPDTGKSSQNSGNISLMEWILLVVVFILFLLLLLVIISFVLYTKTRKDEAKVAPDTYDARYKANTPYGDADSIDISNTDSSNDLLTRGGHWRSYKRW